MPMRGLSRLIMRSENLFGKYLPYDEHNSATISIRVSHSLAAVINLKFSAPPRRAQRFCGELFETSDSPQRRGELRDYAEKN